MQLTLFTLPSRRTLIHEGAVERRAAEQQAKDSRRFDRESKRRNRLTGEATCCLGWYPRSSGWRNCVTCQRPLHYV